MPTYQPAELQDFATRLLKAGGFTASDAAQTADMLVWANLRGVDSHGVLRIPRYVEMIELGLITRAAVSRWCANSELSRCWTAANVPALSA